MVRSGERDGKASVDAIEMDRQLSEGDRRALRGSKFAPLPALPSGSQPRLAHPNGPIATNKAAALAKFLERKLQQPGGLNSIDPNHLELAVKNAKETINASNGAAASSGRTVRHVSSFGDSHEPSEELLCGDMDETRPRKKTRKKVKVSGVEGKPGLFMKKKKKHKKSLGVNKRKKQKFSKHN
ncbi:hypothetical protein HPP92_024934 [Vanilla planifolia]|uniref:Uncharacterized protein n=1 Tax=Vanilla planifolia TaxID=51239 RepID=A0A835PJN7_VANPL|nr:hypothetical protein HPP92_025226 [Vanilla planifolia]KAG0453630.1 hypothetical protein HPP92_024934 [Vanilla planifolia]